MSGMVLLPNGQTVWQFFSYDSMTTYCHNVALNIVERPLSLYDEDIEMSSQ